MYNAHFFPAGKAPKIEMRIIHRILCFRLASFIVIIITMPESEHEETGKKRGLCHHCRLFFQRNGGDCSGILIVQCDSGVDNFNLIAGARHILMEERNNAPELLGLSKIEPVHIVLVVQLPRIAGGCRNFVGFQGGQWMSVHIDELRPPGRNTPSINHLINRPISELFGDGNETRQKKTEVQLLAVNLLRNCVQAAACRIDNEGGTPDRSIQRIELLLQLLPEDFEESGGKFKPGFISLKKSE